MNNERLAWIICQVDRVEDVDLLEMQDKALMKFASKFSLSVIGKTKKVIGKDGEYEEYDVLVNMIKSKTFNVILAQSINRIISNKTLQENIVILCNYYGVEIITLEKILPTWSVH